MTHSNVELKAAQARWALNLTVLQEEERRLFSMFEVESRRSASPSQDTLERLKAARFQCDEAFKMLMGAIEDRIKQATVARDATSPQGDAR